MLSGLKQFVIENKAYFLILVLLAVFFAVAYSGHPEETSFGGQSPAVEEFKVLEDQARLLTKDPAVMVRFFSQNPILAISYPLALLFVFAIFVAGLILWILFLTQPSLKEQIFAAPWVQSAVQWKVGMLFRTLVLFVTGSIGLGWGLAMLRRFLWPGLSENLLILLHTVFSDILCLWLVFYSVRVNGGTYADLGFRKPEGKVSREIFAGWKGYVAIFPVFIGVLLLLLYLVEVLKIEPPAHPLVGVFLEEEGVPWMILFSMFLATVVGPVIEEIFFRGFCYPVLKSKIGKIWAMIATSAFFALIHENSFAFLPIFILGMGLNYLYEKRQSIIAPITLHLTHNLVFIGYFFLTKNIIQKLVQMP